MGADMTKGSLTKNGGETSSPKEMVDLCHLLVGRSLNHLPFDKTSSKFRPIIEDTNLKIWIDILNPLSDPLLLHHRN